MLPAIAGYPHLTVPMGSVHGLPVGLSLIGPRWSEASLLAMAFAYEQRSAARQVPGFLLFDELIEQTLAAEEN